MNALLTWLQHSDRRFAFAVALLAWLCAASAGRLGLWQGLDLAAYDLMLRLQPKASVPPVTVVTIDEQDIRNLGTWPVPDGILARAILAASQAGARVVAVDLYRDFPIAGGPQEAPSLEQLLSSRADIVFPLFLGSGPDRVDPPSVLAADGDQVGFSDTLLDADGKVRRGLLYADDGRTVYRSLALQVARRYLREQGIEEAYDGPWVRLGATTIPRLAGDAGGYVGADAGGYQFMLDYAADFRAAPRCTFSALLAGDCRREDLAGRAVMIGVTAPSLKDFFFVPRGAEAPGAPGAVPGTLPGIHLQAHVVAQLLRMAAGESRPLRVAPEAVELAWVLAWALGGAWWGSRSRRPVALLASVGLAATVIAAAHYGLFRAGLWLPGGVAPVLAAASATAAMLARSLLRARRQQARARRMFASQVGPEIADWLEREAGDADGLPARDLTVTVLFSDLAGFSAIVERKGPHFALKWLNEYMAAMRQVIAAHHGVVLQYAGDAIFAVFGAPLPRHSSEEVREDARNAVVCAIAINEELRRLNAAWLERGWLSAQAGEGVGVRIGIHTGPVVAGSIGESQFWRYTLFGQTVNMAARIETLGKEAFHPDPLRQPCRVLLTDETRVWLPASIALEDLGEFRVHNMERPVRVFKVALDAAPARSEEPAAP